MNPARPMKVLLVHDKEPVAIDAATGVCAEDAGGLALYLASLAHALRRHGLQVVTVAFGGAAPDTLGEPAQEGLYRLPAFRHRYRSDVADALLGILDREAPDVVHLHALSFLHPRLVQRLTDARPLLWTFHDVFALCFRHTLLDSSGTPCTRALGLGCATSGCYRPGELEPAWRDTLRLFLQPRALRDYARVPLVATPSGFLRDALVRNGFDPERVEVAPLFSRFEDASGPNDSRCADASAPAGADPDRTPHLLFVGRLSREKGLLPLLSALEHLRDRPWRATLVGDGALREELTQRLSANGLADRVRLVGELGRSELGAVYADTDVVVFPSLAMESFGLVGVEAMAHGLPVIAFDSGGVREWLRDGENGRIARHGDTEHLAECLDELLSDPRQRATMGAAGRDLQRAEYTEERHVARLLELYERAVREQGEPSK